MAAGPSDLLLILPGILGPKLHWSLKFGRTRINVPLDHGLAHATGVHERNTVPYARFALKKRHGFCAKAREKNMQRHRLGTL